MNHADLVEQIDAFLTFAQRHPSQDKETICLGIEDLLIQHKREKNDFSEDFKKKCPFAVESLWVIRKILDTPDYLVPTVKDPAQLKKEIKIILRNWVNETSSILMLAAVGIHCTNTTPLNSPSNLDSKPSDNAMEVDSNIDKLF